MIIIKHISINVSKEIKNILPDTLEKDLQENEQICPVCHGLGVIIGNNPYGIKGDTSEAAKKSHFPYNHQAIKFCPNCFNGVITLCEYCGKPLPRGRLKCDCEQQKVKDEEERRIKYQETIAKATEVGLKEISTYLYDEKSDKYFADKNEFAEYYWDLYLDKEKVYDYNFDDYFENHVPPVLWLCDNVDIFMDANYFIESACEELHEDAEDNISYEDRKELQELLDDWCKKQTGITTLYPNYKEYVRVKKEWFD